jgi:prephenate dehydrogenase
MRSSILMSDANGPVLAADVSSSAGISGVRDRGLPARVGIVGLGLIGGSLARALKKRAGIEWVIAYDMNPDSLRKALEDGSVDEIHPLHPGSGTDGSDDASFPDFSALSRADLIFICTPVHTVAPYAEAICAVSSGLVTDVASTKSAVCHAVRAPNFIGGHPMAGSERVGYGASAEGLFENAVYVLCVPTDMHAPNEASSAFAQQLEQLESVIRRIGAFPLHLTPETHDQAVAAISHLPHVAASALTLLASRHDQGVLGRLAAGGFRDITRIASSDADLWTAICLSARPALLPLIEAYRSTLAEFAVSLEKGDAGALRKLFADAADYRNGLPIDGRGALEALSTLTVYLSDQPGELGKVTTLLGRHGINIRNIRIRDFRTYEGGVLQILLPDSRQAKDAAVLLKEAGYEID